MESFLNCQNNLDQNQESIYESQENLTMFMQQSQFKNIDSEVSETIQFSEEEQEMENLINSFDSITKNNISKNIIKAFFAFLTDKNNINSILEFAYNGGSFTLQQALKKIKNFSQKYNYNNNHLQKLILHPLYGKILEFYLTFEAQQWLNESKVQQKDKHLIYINFLKLCCANTSYLKNLTKYNKHRKFMFNDRS
ncbi:hypothetical protein TTHERM_01104850 (macronuclear) [Tetrahymena thermophila SB210]|uniref:Uncharacterized protein n=1 Tax=Tetrahymena thermophila (strain SB210) TaxID=312017 RepID=Q24D74_TETTS|nr:hypothetical protein TTHERM_01104850 [Tetrahymena thermophila SB210]EAS05715.1 hypothetical protein TTHERM_01104850 [Tetrahymena thermophila SB210]|eukprot:XP_001025960.1 hypothetical protein TTHERM_01104850 [Tetrahymena thermophila SB210]